ncbi:TonB-dependent receptor [Niveispirillum sp. BGYR6]|uniref:TonB-dependent receptor domain-containing protein n=1 Tax=Niveispirillum sp. BGYR6 TaxID=2971249 RepID=UPI0022B9CB11|nr:TonB-dependent receptor [Niveispirillum sp. BGYR6]MDG5494877.1 TonB-dependent receptor [Niveispirillum sp. BGYR6]
MMIKKQALIDGRLRRSLLIGAAIGLAVVSTASAQEPVIEEIVVTGSRIARPELTSSSPVAVVDAAAFEQAGAATVDSVLNELPQIIPSLGSFSNNGGNGSATVDLRGIGPSRTLVLVNGRRFIPTNGDGTVDLNNIPASLVKQVQVLTGGASAVYGSDAIAGVVNFILNDEFQGAQASARYGITGEGDGKERNINFTLGTGSEDGRSHLTFFAEYNKRDEVMAGDRDFSKQALTEGVVDGKPTLLFSGSTNTPGARLARGTTVLTWDANGVPRNFNSTRTPTSAGDLYNFSPVNYLRVPQERWSLYATGKHEVNDHINLYAETTYTSNRVPLQLAETPANIPQPRPGVPPIRINLTNPQLTAQTVAQLRALYPASADPTFVAPAGFTANDYASITTANALSRRMTELGPREQDNNQNAFNTTFGTKGDLFGDFKYDTYFTFGRVSRDVIVRNDVSSSRLRQALNATRDAAGNAVCVDAAARAQGCVPIDIFGPGRISKAAAAYVRSDTNRMQEFEQQVWNGSISGPLFELPAGALSVAIGSEWRKNKYFDRVDDSIRTGDILGFNPALSSAGSFDVWEGFAETYIPLVKDQPFFHNLSAEAAFRYSDYSSVGGVTAWKAGMEWSPVADIGFRGQFQAAVRAPNVLELFRGGQVSFPTLNSTVDPCLLSTAANYDRNFCISQGVPAGVVGTAAFNAGRPTQLQSLIQGASVVGAELKEEESKTWTVGAVLTPSFLPEFTATIDWWQIKLEDRIGDFGGGAAGVIRDCFTSKNLQSTNCRAITRTADGYLAVVQVPTVNNANRNTAGVDFGWVWNGDLPDSLALFGDGTFRIKNDVTYRYKYDDQPAINGFVYKCAGYGGPSFCGEPLPRLKSTASFTYRSGPLTTTMQVNYIGSWKNEALLTGSAANTLVYPEVDDYYLFDLSGSYEVLEGVTVSAGVTNLFDKKPPMLPDTMIGSQQNTFSNTYDVLGQRFFLSTTVKF